MNIDKIPNESLTQQYGEMFERFAREFFSPQIDGEEYGFKPSVDVKETLTGYIVSAELPGLKQGDISLSLRDNALVIEGTSTDHKKFYRMIALRSDVDDEKIYATFRHSLLSVTLVKRADGTQKTKKIPIHKH